MEQEDVQNSSRQRDQQAQAREDEAKIRSLMRNLLDSAAYDRLANIRLSNPTLHMQVVSYVFSLYRAGKLKGKLSEEELKAIAASLLSSKNSSITRFSK